MRAIVVAAALSIMYAFLGADPAWADPAGIRARDVVTGFERPRDLVAEQRQHEAIRQRRLESLLEHIQLLDEPGRSAPAPAPSPPPGRDRDIESSDR